MEMKKAPHPEDFEACSAERIRKEFLIQQLFLPGKIRLVYSDCDRMIVGGVCPQEPIPLPAGKEFAADYFLQRREMGIINVGPRGGVRVDGESYILETNEGLYLGSGAKEIIFSSADPMEPARFYCNSGPAHVSHPNRKIERKNTESTRLGSIREANVRTIHKYIHPQGVPSCQLVMGMTVLEPGSVWNSMPCHTHARRMEVYFSFNLPPEAVLFHFLGVPDRTRHIVIRNEEAVISPSWSIHSGVGTSSYSFIWGMLGENQTFSDMDAVAMEDLK
jgi:4-deoxy-L-threo-5-hexosulose-uronate ketol-isomerase